MILLFVLCFSIVTALESAPCIPNHKQFFTMVYDRHLWPDGATRSGKGSDLKETPFIRSQIPQLVKTYQISSILDAGCGEFYWQKELDLSALSLYMGVDIVETVITHNKQRYESDTVLFSVMDIVSEEIPRVDLIICRDVLQHLPDTDIKQVVRNIKRSKSLYLLTSTFRSKTKNVDPNHTAKPLQARVTGVGRNLELPPFNFPTPIDYINEGFEGKTLGLWRIADLPDFEEERKSQEAVRAQLLEDAPAQNP